MIPFADRARVRGFFLKDAVMAAERTFSIIKPDATARNLTGAINAAFG
jgi:hypothetical protein